MIFGSQNGPKIVKNDEKRRWEIYIVSEPFSEVFLSTFGVQNGGKIAKNLSKMRSENENGDFCENRAPVYTGARFLMSGDLEN